MRSSGYGSVAAAMETAALENAEAMLLRLETDPTARGERGVSILHGVVAGADASNLGFDTTNALVLEEDERIQAAEDEMMAAEDAESSGGGGGGDGVADDDVVSTTTTTTTDGRSRRARILWECQIWCSRPRELPRRHQQRRDLHQQQRREHGRAEPVRGGAEHGLGGVGASAGSSRYSGGGVGAAAAARTDDCGVKVTSTGGSDTRYAESCVLVCVCVCVWRQREGERGKESHLLRLHSGRFT